MELTPVQRRTVLEAKCMSRDRMEWTIVHSFCVCVAVCCWEVLFTLVFSPHCFSSHVEVF